MVVNKTVTMEELMKNNINKTEWQNVHQVRDSIENSLSFNLSSLGGDGT
jgi:hypothetical protein